MALHTAAEAVLVALVGAGAAAAPQLAELSAAHRDGVFFDRQFAAAQVKLGREHGRAALKRAGVR